MYDNTSLVSCGGGSGDGGVWVRVVIPFILDTKPVYTLSVSLGASAAVLVTGGWPGHGHHIVYHRSRSFSLSLLLFLLLMLRK